VSQGVVAATVPAMDEQRLPNERAGEEQDARILEYAGPQTGHMQVVARFPDPLQAHLAALKLESQGIVCQAMDLPAAVYSVGLQAGVLAVQDGDVQRAVEILARTPARAYLVVPRPLLPPVRVLPALACPRCGCNDVGHPKRWGPVLAGVALLLVWPAWAAMQDRDWLIESCVLAMGLAAVGWVLWLKDRPWRCGRCGHQWRGGDADAGGQDKPSNDVAVHGLVAGQAPDEPDDEQRVYPPRKTQANSRQNVR